MRHRSKKTILGRTRAPRKALLRSLSDALITREKIITSSTKARVLRPLVEKLLTIAKNPSVHARRSLAKYLSAKASSYLVKTLAPKYKEKKGGYLRIVKIKNRKGDNAQEVIIEFV